MNLKPLFHKIGGLIKSNSPTILSALGVSGVVTTAYLTGKASFEAARVIETRCASAGCIRSEIKTRDKVELVWKLYIPAGVSGAVTVACIIGGTRISLGRVAAAQAAFSISDLAFNEYKEKVIEEIGANKEQAIRDKIAEDRVKRNPPPSPDILISGPGNVLCCEMYTGRYFTSDIETLRKSQNELNARLLHHDYAVMDDFYDMIRLPPTSYSGDMGWNSDKLMELIFSSILTEDGRPCLTFEYNYVKPLFEGLMGK